MKVKDTKFKGRGVFSDFEFGKNQIVCRCNVIVLGNKDTKVARDTLLTTYLFDWPSPHETLDDDWTSSAIALGVGSLFNHSDEPNLKWEIRRDKLEIVFKTLRPIKKGEEFLFDYAWDGEMYKNAGIPIKLH